LSTTPTTHRRRELWYSGTVQGVGFRYNVSFSAERCRVHGFVCNLADGRVHLVAEGTEGDLDDFQTEIADRMGDRIQSVEAQTGMATGEFRRFDIRT